MKFTEISKTLFIAYIIKHKKFKNTISEVAKVFAEDIADHIENTDDAYSDDIWLDKLPDDGKEYFVATDENNKTRFISVERCFDTFNDLADIYTIQAIFSNCKDIIIDGIANDIHLNKVDIYHGKLINEVDSIIEKQWIELQKLTIKLSHPDINFIKNTLRYVDFESQSDDTLNFLVEYYA